MGPAFVNDQANGVSGRRYKAEVFRDSPLRARGGKLTIASWNVECLTETKLEELQVHMLRMDIGILCLQETHRHRSDYYTSDYGFLLILS